jgi:DNA polymerase-3 subunit gamma/tau
MSYQVLARKYRPSNFSEVVGQEHILRALENSIEHNKLHQAYIFSGTRGLEKQQLLEFLLNASIAKMVKCPSLFPAINVQLA